MRESVADRGSRYLLEGRVVDAGIADPGNRAALLSLPEGLGKFFELDGVELIVEPDAMREIAHEAIKRKTGARALRAIIEEVMLDIMYEVPSAEDVKRVILPRGVIESKKPPILLTEEQVRKAG